jgi:thiosulfate dehydrogenase
MREVTRACVVLPLALVGAACGGTETKEEHGTAADHGAFLYGSKSTSDSRENLFSCATCHSTTPDASRLAVGGPLAGATERPSYWGGTVFDLLAAINACRTQFMSARDPWLDADEDAKAMYAYLKSLPSAAPGVQGAQPFTVVRTVQDVSNGDAAQGGTVFERACAPCHGAVHTGKGRVGSIVPRLPEDTVREHVGYTAREVRLVFVEKTRHGGFLGYGGTMAPFSTEALSDADLGALLAFLGQ